MTIMLAALLLALQATPPPVTPVEKPFYRAQHSPFCAEWRNTRGGTDDESRIRRAAYRLWVEGYISGFNIHGPDPAGDLVGAAAWEEVAAFVDDHCARNPSHAIVDAMRPLAAHFIRRRPEPTLRPPPVSCVVPGTCQARAGGPLRKRAMVAMTATCGHWNEDRDNPVLRMAYGRFAVGGYLTAYNLWGPDPAGDVIGSGDDAVVEAWLDQWCRDRPAHMLIFAMQPLIDHLAAERAAGRLPPPGMRPTDRLSPASRERD